MYVNEYVQLCTLLYIYIYTYPYYTGHYVGIEGKMGTIMAFMRKCFIVGLFQRCQVIGLLGRFGEMWFIGIHGLAGLWGEKNPRKDKL